MFMYSVTTMTLTTIILLTHLQLKAEEMNVKWAYMSTCKSIKLQ